MKMRKTIRILSVVLLSMAVVASSFLLLRHYFVSAKSFIVQQSRDELRKSVVENGFRGTIEDKKRAIGVIRRLTSSSVKSKSEKTRILISRDQKILKNVRRGSPAPQLRSGPFAVEDRAILEICNEPVRPEDIEAACNIIGGMQVNDSAETRKEVVAKLSALGEAGLAELSVFLQDPDEAICAYAFEQYVKLVQLIENDNELATAVKLGVLSTSNPERLNKLSCLFPLCANETTSVAAIIDIVEFGKEQQIATAVDAYETVTGDEWSDLATAKAWLRRHRETDEGDEAVEKLRIRQALSGSKTEDEKQK